MKRLLLVVGAFLFLVGCPAEVSKPVIFVDAGLVVIDAGDVAIDAGDVAIDAGLEPLDAGTGHSSLVYSITGTLLDGGTTRIDAESAEIDVLRGLTINSVALRDYRIRVIDGSDQVVPSDDTATELDGGSLNYSISFVQPLKPGRNYTVTIESQVGVEFTDTQGKPWADVRLALKTRGVYAPEPGAKASKKKKKR